MAEPIISAVEPIFTYENIKNNQKIRDQWINYILQKSKDKRRQSLLTQFLGSNTLQINKLTPESFDTINKILGAPAILDPAPATSGDKDNSGNTDAYGLKLFHDAMDGNIVTPDSIRAAEYVRQLRAANAAKAQAEAEKKAKAEAAAKAAAGKNNKPGKKPRMSDDEIDAFLKEELGEDTTGNDTYASSGIPKGGTKTIGNASEQERRDALIDEWNKEHGISYVTGKDGVIYRIDPQHPNGYVDPFKNDLSTWTRATRSGSTGYATGQGMLTSGSNGTYATGEGIKDANGNVLTNPGGGVDYQYALKHPEYGLVIRGRMSEPQKDYLQAVSNNMGYNYNF